MNNSIDIKREKNRLAVKKYSTNKRRAAGVPLLTKPESVETIKALSRTAEDSGCWIWTRGSNKAGYGVIVTGGIRWLAHRLSWKVHHGEIPAGKIVCHKCDTPGCVNPEHLFIGTHQDNMADMNSKGRHATGASVKTTKLTESQVVKIRGMTGAHREIAACFGVSRSCVGLIKSGKNWRHV